jgi:hypothetical protein
MLNIPTTVLLALTILAAANVLLFFGTYVTKMALPTTTITAVARITLPTTTAHSSSTSSPPLMERTTEPTMPLKVQTYPTTTAEQRHSIATIEHKHLPSTPSATSSASATSSSASLPPRATSSTLTPPRLHARAPEMGRVTRPTGAVAHRRSQLHASFTASERVFHAVSRVRSR